MSEFSQESKATTSNLRIIVTQKAEFKEIWNWLGESMSGKFSCLFEETFSKDLIWKDRSEEEIMMPSEKPLHLAAGTTSLEIMEKSKKPPI